MATVSGAGAVGRPRKSGSKRRGNTAREEILDASAELFTTKGYATTSTHQIADAVGIRQASLYYHFPSKTEIFLTLLKSTVEPSMMLAEALGNSDATAPMRLWALVAAEARLLLSTRWNVGRLYQLPIASSDEFAEFHEQNEVFKNYFRQLASEIIGPHDPRVELPYYLTQTVTEMRPNNGIAPWRYQENKLPKTAIMLADAALTVIGAPLPENRVEQCLQLMKTETDGQIVPGENI